MCIRDSVWLPWSCKFIFGALNDCVPIYGYKRKPYIAIGWGFSACMLLVLAFKTIPAPYYCYDEHHNKLDTVCNAEAAEAGGGYTLLMMAASFGLIVAEVAADGLLVVYSHQESADKRGGVQMTAMQVRYAGSMCSTCMVAFLMNSTQYNGDWNSAVLSYNAVMGIIALPAVLMAPAACWCIYEPVCTHALDGKQYLRVCWRFFRRLDVLYIVVYCFFFNLFTGTSVNSTASGNVQQEWAKVKNLQNNLFTALGQVMLVCGLWVVKKYFLQASWRKLQVVATLGMSGMDACMVFMTVFDVLRSQYFYMGDQMTEQFAYGAQFIVLNLVVIEVADEGNEGIVYGILTSISNLGEPVGRGMSNQLYALFTPSLSRSANYTEDSPAFRRTVAYSFALQYSFVLIGLVFVLLLPSQKAELLARKQTWPASAGLGVGVLVFLGVVFVYFIVIDVLSTVPVSYTHLTLPTKRIV
eukprot:TRINITY_DN6310_c0_g2_i1.p1 TRINITY_DN6310_c0_g2~~TRINITY_DN6310_c0_g2_i1.p1  ORF type:complete len:468 (+),score=108.45 TRINITY_DN6310_c0_g2_i1:180-1583(+)